MGKVSGEAACSVKIVVGGLLHVAAIVLILGEKKAEQ